MNVKIQSVHMNTELKCTYGLAEQDVKGDTPKVHPPAFVNMFERNEENTDSISKGIETSKAKMYVSELKIYPA